MGDDCSLLGSGECAIGPYKPMTLNDQELSDLMIIIHRNHAILEYLTREGKEATLFIALSDIEKAAHSAQIRLNQIRFGKS